MTTPNALLRGDRVRLTTLHLADVPAMAAWEQDSQFLRLYDARPARPRSEAELSDSLRDRRDDPNSVIFGIRPIDEEVLVGTVELDGILWAHGVCGLGIAIGERSNWGKGYGREAAHLALAFAFHELNLYRVTATVFAYNQRSIHLVERLGFRREGAFREFIERDGQRHDMLLYGLLRPEWGVRRSEQPGE